MTWEESFDAIEFRKKYHGIKLAIGVPLGTEWIPAPFWFSYEELNKPDYYKLITVTGALTPIAREQIVVKALEAECTHLLFIDSDMTFRANALFQLLERDKDIVHGKFFSRYEPYEPCVWVNGQRKNVNVFSQVEHAGLAFSLIKMEVFKKIPRPWFELQMYPKLQGEDVMFHTKARAAGFEAWIDPDVYVGHLSLFAVRRNPDGMFKISRN